MNRAKHLIKLIVFAVLAGILLLIGAGKGLSTGSGFALNWGSLGRIAVLIFLTLTAEHVILLLLSFLNPKGHRARTVVTVVMNLLRYVVIIAIIIGVLCLLEVDMPTILAGIGVVALIIGFGAESLITDVVTGMFILVDNQYNVGDIIEVNGFRGTVQEIGIRTTSIVDTGGNVKIINNSEMKNILNRSDNASKALADFPIPYETDLEKLEQKIPGLLQEIYQKNTEVLKSVPVYLGVQELADSAVVLRFVAEVGESDIYAGARLLNHDLFIGFRKLGVECPFQQVDIHNK